MEQVGECYHHLCSKDAGAGARAGLCVVSEKQGKSSEKCTKFVAFPHNVAQ